MKKWDELTEQEKEFLQEVNSLFGIGVGSHSNYVKYLKGSDIYNFLCNSLNKKKIYSELIVQYHGLHNDFIDYLRIVIKSQRATHFEVIVPKEHLKRWS